MTSNETALMKLALMNGWSLGEYVMALWRLQAIHDQPEFMSADALLSLYRPVNFRTVQEVVQ